MKNRIIGFDLARAWAILGMFIVNFNTVFGKHDDPSVFGQFLGLFNGNSSTLFVILAGMGVSLLTYRPAAIQVEKQQLRQTIHNGNWIWDFAEPAVAADKSADYHVKH